MGVALKETPQTAQCAVLPDDIDKSGLPNPANPRDVPPYGSTFWKKANTLKNSLMTMVSRNFTRP